MNRRILFALATFAGAAVVTPVMGLAATADRGSPDQVGAGPFQLDAEQIRALQQKLNRQGFSSGHVDGSWGPITSKAVTQYQRKAGLEPTGQLNAETLHLLGFPVPGASPAATPVAAEPQAATAPPVSAPAIPPVSAPVAPPPAPSPTAAPARPETVSPAMPVPAPSAAAVPPIVAPASTDQPAAKADDAPPSQEQAAGASAAADPTKADADRPKPTPGANSFTEGQAQERIADQGFAEVQALRKGDDGVWRGTAMKDGQRVEVWLDYQGDVGRE